MKPVLWPSLDLDLDLGDDENHGGECYMVVIVILALAVHSLFHIQAVATSQGNEGELTSIP